MAKKTLHDLSIELADGYQTALEVDTMLQTLRDALGEEISAFICSLILKQFGNVLKLLDSASHEIENLGVRHE